MKDITEMHKDMLLKSDFGAVESDINYWLKSMRNEQDYVKKRNGDFGSDWRNLEDVLIVAAEILNEKK